MIYDVLIAPFADYDFMRRALVGSCALALSGAPVGVFLMLRRMALTGDAMAHAILPGAAVGYLMAGLSLGAMTIGGLIAGFVVAVMSGVVARFTTLREDASLAAFYLVSLALGVTIVSLRGSNIDLLHVLFGSILGLDDDTFILLAVIASLTLMGLAVLYRPLVLETVDPVFLRHQRRHAGGIAQILFLGLVVLNLVGGFHALGTLLAVGLMMVPAASARLWTRDLTRMLAVAILCAMVASYSGLVISFYLGTPTGPMIILMAGVMYLVSLVLNPTSGLLHMVRASSHLEA
jgi:zinc/manganese transport system permease protein